MKVIAASICFGVLSASVHATQERPAADAKHSILRQLTGASVQEPLPGRSATIVYGAALAQGASPVESARALLDRTGAALGIDQRSLELAVGPDGQSILDIGRDSALGGPRFHGFRFQQVHDGLPVFRAGVGFLVRAEPGFPVVLSAFDVKDVSGLDTTAARVPGAREPSASMLAALDLLLDKQLFARGVPLPARTEAIETSEQELVVFTGSAEAPLPPTLALKFVATRGSARANAERFQRHLVLASVATGEILLAEDIVQELTDVVGSVSGFATQGVNSLECDPEGQVALPYAEATVVGGNTVFADENGQFVIPHGGTGSVTVRSRLRGQYFEVFNDITGGTTPELTASVTPPGPIDFVHNPTPVEHSTSGVNAYVAANFVRDYVLSYAPGFPTIGSQTFFNLYVNEDSRSGITSCNAVYTGTDLVFWRNTGGCNNSAFADVVYHEYGHHLVSVTGNGQGQFGEGSGDVIGVLIQDNPSLGEGFTTCGVGIRTANNSHQYPCSGGIHDCGQLISGCVWSLRNELVATEPVDYRDIGASLFVNMLIVRGQMVPGSSTIDPLITVIYLTLDDDDATIGNGTPHYAEIASAFGDHGMDAPPLSLIGFSYPSGRPEVIDPNGGGTFTFEVTAISEAPVPGTGTLYVDRGAGVESFSLPQLAPNVYQVSFPPTTLPCGSTVRYYLGAETSSGPIVLDPPGAPDARFEAIAAASLATTFEDDFELNLGWSVSGTATDGQWERAVPAGGGDRGDPPSDADGSGSCYVTDNADGNSDVDGGTTILLSPVLDATTVPGGNPLIAYSRWFSNNIGVVDDTFLVEISNNGGASWVTLETVGATDPEAAGGWYEKVFLVSDHIAPTSTMRLRFTARDLGAGSVVEAGVDHVRVLQATCSRFRARPMPSAPPPRR